MGDTKMCYSNMKDFQCNELRNVENKMFKQEYSCEDLGCSNAKTVSDKVYICQ